MRRRCFFILILVLTLLAFIDALGIPLKPAQLPPGESEAITCTGKILRIQSKDGRTDMQIKLLTYGDKKVDFSENVLVSVYENLNACSLSRSIISFRAVLRDAPEAGNPHCFNYRKYLKSKGIGKIAAIRTFKIVETQFTPADLYERAIYRARSEFLQSVSVNARGMISGVLFGDTSLMEEDVSEEFRQNGTSHILAVSGLHVGILVLSRDLGSAVIFFAAYLVMIYVASRNVGYLALGLAGGSAGAVVAYHLFGHVRQRVTAWKNPMAVYQNEGYQIVQSLFAIGTGGWFGMGLCQGSPEKIPVVKNDFIFSAICEELGGIFAICLILVCMSFFLMIVNIALKIKKPFYKLIALGLGTEYAFQVFLTIGGATKFIPMTGVTLPLVSYGGSSVACTVLMLAIIQGLYILREDEDEEIERYRRKGTAQRVEEAPEAQSPGDF